MSEITMHILQTLALLMSLSLVPLALLVGWTLRGYHDREIQRKEATNEQGER